MKGLCQTTEPLILTIEKDLIYMTENNYKEHLTEREKAAKAVWCNTCNKIINQLRKMDANSEASHKRNIDYYRGMSAKIEDIGSIERNMYMHAAAMETVALDSEHRVYCDFIHYLKRAASDVYTVKNFTDRDFPNSTCSFFTARKLRKTLTNTEKQYIEYRMFLQAYMTMYGQLTLPYFHGMRAVEIPNNCFDDVIVDRESYGSCNYELSERLNAINDYDIIYLTAVHASKTVDAISVIIDKHMDKLESLLPFDKPDNGRRAVCRNDYIDYRNHYLNEKNPFAAKSSC